MLAGANVFPQQRREEIDSIEICLGGHWAVDMTLLWRDTCTHQRIWALLEQIDPQVPQSLCLMLSTIAGSGVLMMFVWPTATGYRRFLKHDLHMVQLFAPRKTVHCSWYHYSLGLVLCYASSCQLSFSNGLFRSHSTPGACIHEDSVITRHSPSQGIGWRSTCGVTARGRCNSHR